MKTLKYTFIDPFIFNHAPLDVVVRNGRVVVDNNGHKSVYEFNDGVTPYPDGSGYILHRNMSVISNDEAFLDELARQQRLLTNRRKESAEREAREARAIEFNSSLNVPVAWRPEIKPVIGGLTASSAGNGHSRRTVEHIYLLEQLDDGRLHRQANSYLCSSAGSFHTLVSGHDDTPNAIEVTCKKCLQIASRWQKND